MSELLLIGKELPDCLDFAESLSKNGRKIFTTSKDDNKIADFEAENIFSAGWNKASAISSRALLIKNETKLPATNEYIIYFDSQYYAQKFDSDRAENITMSVDAMINSYQFFLSELLFRLEQKKEEAVIVFLVKTYPSKYEIAHFGSKNVNMHPSSNIVNAAQQAFISLAQNISTLVGERSYLSVLLAKCEPSNELFSSEKALAEWTAQGIDTIKNMKNHQTAKQAGNWVKVGAKIPTGFSLFK